MILFSFEFGSSFAGTGRKIILPDKKHVSDPTNSGD